MRATQRQGKWRSMPGLEPGRWFAILALSGLLFLGNLYAPAFPTGGSHSHPPVGGSVSTVGTPLGKITEARPGPLTLNPTWGNLTPALPSSPSARTPGGMVYDAADGNVLLFGGCCLSSGIEGDTWTFHAGAWTNRTPSLVTSPGPSGWGAMTYDTKDGYVLYFSGSTDQTWKYTAGQWTELFPLVSPSPRTSATMAYDALDNYVVLFGGYNGTATLNDTWTYSGGNWTDLGPKLALSPPARSSAAMAYDPLLGGLVLFGGCASVTCAQTRNDTWEFHGGSWSPLTETLSPASRSAPAMGWDGTSSQLILYGGESSSGHPLNDTWTLGTGTWTNLTSGLALSPPALYGASLVNDTGGSGFLLFGGRANPMESNQTWLYGLPPLTPLMAVAKATPLSGPAPLTVSFNGQATGGVPPYTFSWNFGDASSLSPLQDPTHTYNASGGYTVTLTVHDSIGNSATHGITVTVQPSILPLQLSLGVSPITGTAPLTVTVWGNVTGGSPPYTYYWNFGDGTLSALASPPPHVYSNAGVYNIFLQVNDSAQGVVRALQEVVVNAVPPPPGPLTVHLTGSHDLGVAPLVDNFSASVTGGTAPYSYSWAFGDGTVGTGALVQANYTRPGTYRVELWVNDSAGKEAVSNLTVTVLPSLNITLAATPGDPIVGQLVTFTAGTTGGDPPYTYLWSGLPAGCLPINSSQLSCRPTAAGVFTSRVEVTDAIGDTANATISTTVNRSSTGTSGPSPTNSNSGTPLWVFVVVSIAMVAGALAVALFLRQRHRKLSPVPPSIGISPVPASSPIGAPNTPVPGPSIGTSLPPPPNLPPPPP